MAVPIKHKGGRQGRRPYETFGLEGSWWAVPTLRGLNPSYSSPTIGVVFIPQSAFRIPQFKMALPLRLHYRFLLFPKVVFIPQSAFRIPQFKMALPLRLHY
jgi:hypothetical protein